MKDKIDFIFIISKNHACTMYRFNSFSAGHFSWRARKDTGQCPEFFHRSHLQIEQDQLDQEFSNMTVQL